MMFNREYGINLIRDHKIDAVTYVDSHRHSVIVSRALKIAILENNMITLYRL